MGVLSAVRMETRAVHQSLDDHPLLVQFMAQSKPEAYRGFLAAFSLFLNYVSSSIDLHVSELDRDVLDYRPWLYAVTEDLAALAPVPHLDPGLLPDFSNKSEFWGLLYVLEGSVLGGSQVASSLPQRWPQSFLKRGAQARLRWPYFCRRLGELETAGELEADRVSIGAVKAFAAMVKIFDRMLVSERSEASKDTERSLES